MAQAVNGNSPARDAHSVREHTWVVGEVARFDTDSDIECRGAETLDIVLDALPLSVSTARHAVGRLMEDSFDVPPEVAEDVLLLVSELVTNAVLHARTAVRVSARAEADRVMVAVGDDDPHHAPLRPEQRAMATSGRGMMIVELLASSWGVDVQPTSKVVWFEAAYRPSSFDLRGPG